MIKSTYRIVEYIVHMFEYQRKIEETRGRIIKLHFRAFSLDSLLYWNIKNSVMET